MIWMKTFFAYFFRTLLRIPGLKKFHYLLYKRIFVPTGLFRGLQFIVTFNKSLRLHVRPSEWIQQHVFLFGSYELRSIELIQSNLPTGGVFLDVGANIGCHTLIAAEKVGNTGVVHAFEAITSTCVALTKNVNLNDFSNVVINHCAVYEENTTLELFVANQDNMGMSSVFQRNEISSTTERVAAITLDSYVAQHKIERVDFLKMDIEGAEFSALKGMKNTLSTFHPKILLEISADVMTETKQDPQKILDFLFALNYQMYGVSDKAGLIETKKLLDGIDDYFFQVC